MRKVFVEERGFRGLYRGFGAVAMGVAPEKGMKLFSNSKMRELLGHEHGVQTLPLVAEGFAGGFAGFAQSFITQPLEMVKQHGQLMGMSAAAAGGGKGAASKTTAKYTGVMSSISQLGFRGLYNNWFSTLLRDIPFTVVFFAVSYKLKEALCVYLEGSSRQLEAIGSSEKPGSKLPAKGAAVSAEGSAAGAREAAASAYTRRLNDIEKTLNIGYRLGISTFAGVLAAAIATPADFLKTRLQADYLLKTGEYKGLVHGFRTILRKEGIGAFKTGMGPRVMTRAPMFGITLTMYDLISNFLEANDHFEVEDGETVTGSLTRRLTGHYGPKD
jgi:hypothetical protein